MCTGRVLHVHAERNADVPQRVEGQPALRADVVYVLPEGGLNALASVLERFKTFHENLESISEASHASLTRIIRWLKGGS